MHRAAAQADACCLCVNGCGRSTGHSGRGSRCKHCSLTKSIEYNRNLATQANAQADKDAIELKAMEARVTPT